MADDASNMSQEEIDAQLRAAMEEAAGAAANSAPSDSLPAAGSSESAPDVAEDSNVLSQDETDALLRAAGLGNAAAAPAKQARPQAVTAGDRGGTDDTDIQTLLSQAEAAIASVDDPIESSVPGLSPYELQDLTSAPISKEKASLELLRDVELDLRIELGRTLMYLEDVLQLRKGSVVPLDKLAGDPVDVYVNGRLVARGEILVLNDNFCVRVAELVATEKTS
jgi:flagellar motor switch protein FliN